MADRHVPHLLIGGGIAAATAARVLHEHGAGGDVLLVSRELDPPYHRPPVSKGYLRGDETRQDAHIPLPDGVELLTRTSVLGLDPGARVATLSTKQTVSFDTALLATGAMVRRLALDGAQLEGIHYLRALGNADALRRDAEAAEHVVIVGGSYVGCEVAASLTTLGKRCTVLMQEAEPLERHFGARAGRFFRGVLEAHGVEVRGGVEVQAFAGDGERVEGVALAGGERVAGDLVVCGVGAIPDVTLARKAGVEIGPLGGVRCDAVLRSVSHPQLFAAGDMCEYASALHGRALRVEHEDHAAEQGATAARGMLGQDAPHAAVPYFFSDLADWASLEYVGPALVWAREEVAGSEAGGAFAVDYLDGEDRLLARLSVGGAGDLDAARERLRDGR
jgi:3-phenylpropionate/trans-cinnamate dioxygenase ferredoxin reductase component